MWCFMWCISSLFASVWISAVTNVSVTKSCVDSCCCWFNIWQHVAPLFHTQCFAALTKKTKCFAALSGIVSASQHKGVMLCSANILSAKVPSISISSRTKTTMSNLQPDSDCFQNCKARMNNHCWRQFVKSALQLANCFAAVGWLLYSGGLHWIGKLRLQSQIMCDLAAIDSWLMIAACWWPCSLGGWIVLKSTHLQPCKVQQHIH